jgi:hypothetical protein
MEAPSTKDEEDTGEIGDLNALGPMALMRQSFVNSTMSPAQLAANVEKMTAELKVYKDMAAYYQSQISRLTQSVSNPTPSNSAPSPAFAGIRTVPPSTTFSYAAAKAAFHSYRVGDSPGGPFKPLEISADGSELILQDNKAVSVRELLKRCHRAYLESLTVLTCGECIIPLPAATLEQKFIMLCQPLVFHDKRAPEDCTEAQQPSGSHTIVTGEDTPLEVLIDLWEHAVVFSDGVSAMGNHMHSHPASPATPIQSLHGSHSSSTSSPTLGGMVPPISNQTGSSVAYMSSGARLEALSSQSSRGSNVANNGGTATVPTTPSSPYLSAALLNPLVSVMSHNAEKLMRVVVFQREAHTMERYAERLVRALTGMGGHYRRVNKLGAASSLLMIAHQIIATFPSVIPPVLSDRIYVLLLLGATTEHERKEWLHMLHDQIHFTTTTLLSFNVGFIVSKLRTNPVITPAVLEEISGRINELETLVPTLTVEVPLFQVWVKALIACFHSEVGARCGDMERASLALARAEQLLRDNYSSSLAIILLSELRNFALHCSPCSVLINGQEQVLCHYLIDKIQAIHDEHCQDDSPTNHMTPGLKSNQQVSISMTPPTPSPLTNHPVTPVSPPHVAPVMIIGGAQQPLTSPTVEPLPTTSVACTSVTCSTPNKPSHNTFIPPTHITPPDTHLEDNPALMLIDPSNVQPDDYNVLATWSSASNRLLFGPSDPSQDFEFLS